MLECIGEEKREKVEPGEFVLQGIYILCRASCEGLRRNCDYFVGALRVSTVTVDVAN